jgi:hypothetical protein
MVWINQQRYKYKHRRIRKRRSKRKHGKKHKSEQSVYVLELEGGKYYVGWSEHVERRLSQHFAGNGSEVTKQVKPVKILLVRQGTKETGWLITQALAERYGWDRVRGGYCCNRFDL